MLEWGGYISLIPSMTNVVSGSNLTVTVNEDSGAEPVNAVQANFSYPAGLLQYVSITNSAAFSVVAQNSAGSGSVQIARGAMPAVMGSQTVATVTFKALASVGEANLAFTGGTAVVSAATNGNIASSQTGASVTVTAPASTSDGSTSGSQTAPARQPGTDSAAATQPQVLASSTAKNVQTQDQPTTDLVSTGINFSSILGLSSLAAAAGYAASLYCRKFAQR